MRVKFLLNHSLYEPGDSIMMEKERAEELQKQGVVALLDAPKAVDYVEEAPAPAKVMKLPIKKRVKK